MPKRVLEGVIVSDKMDKTIVVKVERRVQHPVYKKFLRRHVTFKAHDEKRDAKIGDRVEIMETRPISKTKTWRLLEVVQRSDRPVVEELPQ
jgi:small subunit ribosomal protein S17